MSNKETSKKIEQMEKTICMLIHTIAHMEDKINVLLEIHLPNNKGEK